jgi:hypothetical protein
MATQKNAPKAGNATSTAHTWQPLDAENATQPEFKRAKAITAQSLSVAKMVAGDSIFVRMEEKILTKPDRDKKGNQKLDPDTEEPINLHIARVTNLHTGELCELVLGHIVMRSLADNYPDDTYVGKKFEMLKGEKKGRTNMWTVYELEA